MLTSWIDCGLLWIDWMKIFLCSVLLYHQVRLCCCCGCLISTSTLNYLPFDHNFWDFANKFQHYIGILFSFCSGFWCGSGSSSSLWWLLYTYFFSLNIWYSVNVRSCDLLGLCVTSLTSMGIHLGFVSGFHGFIEIQLYYISSIIY